MFVGQPHNCWFLICVIGCESRGSLLSSSLAIVGSWFFFCVIDCAGRSSFFFGGGSLLCSQIGCELLNCATFSACCFLLSFKGAVHAYARCARFSRQCKRSDKRRNTHCFTANDRLFAGLETVFDSV